MSRKKVKELGYQFVESDLPAIVRDWCVGDSILCLIQGEFPYRSWEAWKLVKPVPVERVMRGYTIYAGMIVVEPATEN